MRIGSVYAAHKRSPEVLFSRPLHHLLKTFWNGVNGWRDRRLPDGTGIGAPAVFGEFAAGAT